MRDLRSWIAGAAVLLLVACSPQVHPPETRLPASPQPTDIIPPEVTPTVTVPPTPLPARSCQSWQTWPVVPSISGTARELYQRGQAAGNQPHAFSKIGDGEISAEWFLTAFEAGHGTYDLGPYQNLRPVVDYFAGSLGRIGVAARRGFNTERILDPALGDPKICQVGESPLACELRIHRPAFAILSLGTNQVWKPEEFEKGMRQILEILLSKNVVPILSTKGDNLEGDHRINRTIACLAQEYDLPLWNFWAAIQPLPQHGLQPDLEHLTYGMPDFKDAQAMRSAWTIRNLTALQVLEAVLRGVGVSP